MKDYLLTVEIEKKFLIRFFGVYKERFEVTGFLLVGQRSMDKFLESLNCEFLRLEVFFDESYSMSFDSREQFEDCLEIQELQESDFLAIRRQFGSNFGMTNFFSPNFIFQ